MFCIDDHAVLFGETAKAVLQVYPGRAYLVRDIVVLMARERGLRMAMRCLRDGRALSMRNYLLYGEWRDEQRRNRSEVEALCPVYTTKSLQCRWCDCWREHNLLEYGRIYCKYADENLVFGFSPELRLELDSLLSFGDGCCRFRWQGASFSDEAEHRTFFEEKRRLTETAAKPFDYHAAHLLSAARRVLLFNLGLPRGDEIVQAALSAYAAVFGREKRDEIERQSHQDFLVI